MWELEYKESWVLRTDASELWCRRRLLRVSWTERRSIQSILKEISPGYSSEGLMLKLQYFGHLMQRADSFEKTLMLGKIEGRKRRRWQRMRWWMASQTQCTFVWVNSRCWKWTRRPDMLWFMGSQRVGHDWATELNWTEILVKLSNAGSRGRSREMIWGGRWEAGFRTGNSCTPMADSCQYMAKSTQYCKAK